MASTTTTVTIAGMTGKMALLITKYLLRTPTVHINGLCRTPSKLPASLRSHARVSIFESDATNTSQIALALRNSSVAICCYLGGPDVMIQGQQTLIDECIKATVPRYIASDWCLDYTKLKLGDLPAKDPMIIVAEYLKERKEKITAVHVLNGCFLEVPWRSIYEVPAEGEGKGEGFFKYWGTGDERWDLTTYGNAAEYTAKVALDPKAEGYLHFRGDHPSVKEIAATYKEVYGKEPAVKRLGSLDDLYKKMHYVKEQNPGNMWAWLGMFYSYYCIDSRLTKIREPLDNERYPDVKLTTVRDYLEKFPAEMLGKMPAYEDFND